MYLFISFQLFDSLTTCLFYWFDITFGLFELWLVIFPCLSVRFNKEPRTTLHCRPGICVSSCFLSQKDTVEFPVPSTHAIYRTPYAILFGVKSSCDTWLLDMSACCAIIYIVLNLFYPTLASLISYKSVTCNRKSWLLFFSLLLINTYKGLSVDR